MVRLAWTLAVIAASCSGRAPDPAKPGDDHDEGAGFLAQASISFVGGKGSGDDAPARSKRTRVYNAYGGAMYGGDPYGAGAYGGDPYGGASYARWVPPTWNYANVIRPPHYAVTDVGLDATIEGTVTWPGKPPAKLKTACGPFSSVQLGANHGVRGAIVYIERITTGRGVGGVGRAQVGGVIAKHGCTLGPTVQIAVPMPSSVAIHGDAQRTRVRITPPGAVGKLFELQEGGLVTAEIKPGVTKIDGEDGKLAASWILGLDTPYFSITDDTGRFRLEQLAPGTYDLTIWQAPLATINTDGTFAYGSPIVVHRSVHVDAKQTTKVSVALPML